MAAALIVVSGQDDKVQEVAEHAGLTLVRVRAAVKWSWSESSKAWKEWLASDAAQGEYMVTNLINGFFSSDTAHFYFTHEKTAFAFKMRFG